MRFSGLAVPAAAAAVLVLGPQAGANPAQEPVGSMYGQACGYGASYFTTTPFAPVLGAACVQPAVPMPTETVPTDVMPDETMPTDVMPAD
ncbi:hypothetical protein ACFYOT_32145 [Saccharothrix saharensis]|uniref:hypothetical protein n=1 Tax=Saccharothrix saharensis TaxID=571190 RepID=UPI0036C2EB9E